MKILVTGGCGFIGSNFVLQQINTTQNTILNLDKLTYAGNLNNLSKVSKDPRYEFVQGDICDSNLVSNTISYFHPDAIVHTAASYKDPDDWHNDTLTNCVGGANLVRAALDNEVGRFIYFQTALCYGVKPLEQPITLSHPKLPANSSYAISKTAAEDYIEISGLDYVTFRLANVIGPRNVSGPLPIFYQRISGGKKCFVTTARRDFVFVGDLAKAVVRAIDGTGSGAYHFSSGTDVAIKELYDAVVEAMELDEYPEPEIREIGPDDAPSILLDPTRTFEDFGDIEFTPLSETVRAGVQYFQEFGASGGYTHLKHK